MYKYTSVRRYIQYCACSLPGATVVMVSHLTKKVSVLFLQSTSTHHHQQHLASQNLHHATPSSAQHPNKRDIIKDKLFFKSISGMQSHIMEEILITLNYKMDKQVTSEIFPNQFNKVLTWPALKGNFHE